MSSLPSPKSALPCHRLPVFSRRPAEIAMASAPDKDRRSPQARRSDAQNIPTAEYQSVLQRRSRTQFAWLRKDATMIWTRNSSGAARTNRTERPRRPRPAAHIREKVHPKALIDDLLRETQQREHEAGRLRQTCSPTSTACPGRGQDRVLPARPELVEPHDPGGFAAGDGKLRARRAAGEGLLPRSTVWHQVQ